MERPSNAQEWADFYAERASARAATRRAAQPQEHPHYHYGNPAWPKHPAHPLLFARGHEHYDRHAREAIQAQHQAATRERERLRAPHPLVHGPLSRIQIPEKLS
jgi:hypothetical protein